ncbi:MAG: winged helix-turn-helix domain-containing protein [Acidobacteriota bacterium]
MSALASKTYCSRLRLGRFVLDLERHGLYHGKRRMPLSGKPLQTLIYLARNPGRVLTKGLLLEAIWSGVFVTPNTVEHAIAKIRQVLGDVKKDPQFIQTVPGLGYCFISAVEELGDPGRQPVTRPQSIAVLPFGRVEKKGSSDPLGLGVTDSLITRLSNCRNASVFPTASILRFVDQSKDPRESGRELGADLVLAGMIQRLGKQARVSVQLIRVSNGESLWGETLDWNFTDLFSVESAISKRICHRLVPWLCGCAEPPERKSRQKA